MDDPIRSVKDKAKALEERTAKVDAIQAQVSRLERAMQDEEAPRRGGCLGWLFRRRARQPSAALDQAVFGHKASTASTTASDRLSTAAKSMEAHAESLGERAAAARAKAKSLMAVGKKFEALAMLKKAKQAEAQHSNAVATHAALERQIDVLAESALQKGGGHGAVGVRRGRQEEDRRVAVQDRGRGGLGHRAQGFRRGRVFRLRRACSRTTTTRTSCSKS